ncbi:hypothetical protein JIP62_01070 [Brevundimonas vitis]|uniref:Uncharacterized protein n=1 Tax=Brevundimonas vitisensis TaxID=2800818 RepID=A0ABX7BMG8_9CAUL|nr:hypothetical protein [Brevundimonas vitisensis]QQQ18774.1 hypothetical protein JIP62_01070 [Brevundimonas vitisensis]
MKKIAIAVAALACLAATPGHADITSAFGNTVLSRYPDGGWVKHWFNPDGTYAAQFSDGRRLTARWRVEGERVCLTNIRPNMMIPRFCSPMIDAEIGQTWTSRDPLGRRVQNVLLAGRQ